MRRRHHVRDQAAPVAGAPEVAIPAPRPEPEPEPEPVMVQLGLQVLDLLTECIRTGTWDFHIYDGLTGPCRCGLRTRGTAR